MPFLAAIKIVPSWCYWLVALIALCIGCEVHGRHAVEKKWLKKEAEAALQVSEATREQERIMSRSLSAISANHYKEAQNAKVKIDSLVNDVRTGKQRLSVAVSSCSQSGDPTVATGTVAEARVELSQSNAEFLIKFAGECDAVAGQMNSVIQAYDSAIHSTKTPE